MVDDSESLLDLIGEESTRRILTLIEDEALSAPEISDRSDIAVSTVYRKMDSLTDHGLAAEQTVITDDGNRTSVYRSRLEAIHIALTDDGFTTKVDVEDADDMSDQFNQLWTSLRNSEQ